jgi:two-component system response regulator HydG
MHDFRRLTQQVLPVAAHEKTPSFDPQPVTPLADLEREAILEALRKLKGDKLTTARLLGIGKTTLYRKLKEYGISEPMA